MRTHRAALAACAAAVVLAGCGGGEPGGEATPGLSPGGTATVEPSTPAPTSPPASPTPGPTPGPPTGTPAAPAPAQLTIALDETGNGEPRTITLTCAPPGGDHPDPQAACAALFEAGGARAFAPPPRDQLCTQVYGGPQVAAVTGTVGGEQVVARLSRTDGCEIARWEALAPVLGASPTGGT